MKAPEYKRHRSRQLLLQGLYEMQLSGNDPAEIEIRSRESPIYRRIDADYYHRNFRGLVKCQTELEELIYQLSSPSPRQLDPLMKGILLIGIYELLYCGDLDPPVIIQEAILLCKRFMHEGSHTFANALLDQAAKKIRASH